MDIKLDKETLEAIRDFPNLEKEIKEAEKEYKDGNVFTLREALDKKEE